MTALEARVLTTVYQNLGISGLGVAKKLKLNPPEVQPIIESLVSMGLLSGSTAMTEGFTLTTAGFGALERTAPKPVRSVSPAAASEKTEPPEAAELRKLYGRTSTVDWPRCRSVEREPGKVSGAWVFKGTRVSVSALWENLEGGSNLNQFVDHFPGVTRSHLLVVIELLLYSLEQELRRRRQV